MNGRALVGHVGIPFHVHAMLAGDWGDTGRWEEGDEFVSEAAFGVFYLQMGVLFSSALDELLVRALAVVGVEGRGTRGNVSYFCC